MKKMDKKTVEYSSPRVRELLQSRDPLKTARARKRMLIAARIEDILQDLGWKKKDLAEKLGKKPSEVTKWLSGTHNFTIDTLVDIEHATGKAVIPVSEKRAPKMVWQIVVRQEIKAEHEEFIPPVGLLNPDTLKSSVFEKVVNYA